MAEMSGRDAFTGGTQGAALGTSIMPGWGTAGGAVAGALGGLFGLWPGTGEGSPEAAQKKHEENLRKAMEMYQAYRPQALEARLQAMRQAAGMMQPVSTALQRMYGPSAGFDPTAGFQNPFAQMPVDRPPMTGRGTYQGAPRGGPGGGPIVAGPSGTPPPPGPPPPPRWTGVPLPIPPGPPPHMTGGR
jgi:hypothetical protein